MAAAEYAWSVSSKPISAQGRIATFDSTLHCVGGFSSKPISAQGRIATIFLSVHRIHFYDLLNPYLLKEGLRR